MPSRARRSSPRRPPVGLLALALLSGLACGDGTTGPAGGGSGSYSVTVTVTTTGADPDPDGYVVSLRSVERPVGAAGAATFTGVPAGTFTLEVTGLAPNCAVDGGAIRPVTLPGATSVTLSVTCLSVVASGLFTEIACPGLAFTPSAATPFSAVTVSGLPAALPEPLFARAAWDGGPEYALVHVQRATGGGGTTRMPFHPGGDLEGGTVSLRIAGGLEACPPITLPIGPLPEAPGELSAVSAALQAMIAVEADRAGVTVEALRQADAATLPDQLLPLAIAQSVVDRPDNPNSLAAVLAGTAPLTAGIDAATLDRIVAASGLRAALEAILAGTAVPAAIARADALDCVISGIDTPSLLDQCMALGVDAAFRAEGLSNDVLDGIGGLLDVAGSVPYPPAKIAAAVASAGVWAFQALTQGTASLLPTEFVDIRVEAAPEAFREDEEGPGDWAAEVRATSTGWTLDRLALDALNKLMGFTSAHEAYAERYLDGEVVDILNGLVEARLINDLIGTTDGSTILTRGPEIFGPVDVSDPQWTVRTLDPESGPLQFISHTAYEPREPGEAMLGVRTVDGAFGGRRIDLSPGLPLRVEEIAIDLEVDGAIRQSVTVSQPNQAVAVLVRVRNAKYPLEVALDDDPGRAGTATLTPGEPGTLLYIAPADLSGLPDQLVVRHTATTGARATSTEPRAATLEIRQAQIVVSPDGACVAPGATQQYEAVVVGLTNDAVDWSASQGSISSSGLFTAPTGVPPGTPVTITATSREDPDVAESVTATVGCACGFQVTVGGTAYTSQSGDQATYMPDAGQQDGVITVQLTSAASGRSVLFATGGAPVVPGTYEVSNVGGTLAYPTEQGYTNVGGDKVEFTLVAYTPHTLLQGGVTGIVRDAVQGAAGPAIDLSATFQIFPTPEGSGFLTRGCVVP